MRAFSYQPSFIALVLFSTNGCESQRRAGEAERGADSSTAQSGDDYFIMRALGGASQELASEVTSEVVGESLTASVEGKAADAEGGVGPRSLGDVGSCDAPALAISSVQGPGPESPLADQELSVLGLVTGKFAGGADALGGFFLQSLVADGEVATSEGLFIDLGDLQFDVNVGERVRVRGIVAEHHGMTQLTARALRRCGEGNSVMALDLSLPLEEGEDWEHYEGMLLRLRDLVVVDSYNLARYGELLLSAGGRIYQEAETPSNERLSRILLDDGRWGQNREPVPFMGEGRTIRLGDEIPELLGVLHYAFGAYRVHSLDGEEVQVDKRNPRPALVDDVGGDLRIATLNAHNYFLDLNGRGARTSQELSRQREKLVAAIVGMDADIVGLTEVESGGSATHDLLASINQHLGAEIYASVQEPSFLGGDVISSALLYKTERVAQVGDAFSDESAVHTRPPLAQLFSYADHEFLVISTHFKSKGSCPSDPEDENADHGQGCWGKRRRGQSEALLAFVSATQTRSGIQNVIVLGDLNSYLHEDPVALLEAAGLQNSAWKIPEASRYSYVYEGRAGLLDYALASEGFDLVGATVWHINADEPRCLDYQEEETLIDRYQPDAFRASDHDPLVIGVSLR